ncbi:glycosyltransferase [Conyzicola nivalis]|uniref:glycosyltransferase n=1 Tax=Conyzicola nivalis TaxID=1477021 RepID=UPI0016684071|nr:glycosyltransferase [Conyzicola nivalis]
MSSEPVNGYDAVNPVDWLSKRRQDFLDTSASTEPTGLRLFLKKASNSQMAHTVMNLGRLRSRRKQLSSIIEGFQPDIIHALRIPYEGLTVLGLRTNVPRIVSTWGSDFVPMASTDVLLSAWMKRLLKRASGFQSDSRQDIERAAGYGLSTTAPRFYSAGNFGVDNDLFFVDAERPSGVVVYPRKAKANANYAGFVEAAVQLSKRRDLRFVAVGLLPVREQFVAQYGETALESITMTADLTRDEMAALMRSAEVVVSPTFWDGTPVTVLEAIASGAQVIAGELPELRTLKEDGMPIELIDASSTHAIADAISAALDLDQQVATAARLPDQFNREANRVRVVEFYDEVLAADGNRRAGSSVDRSA